MLKKTLFGFMFVLSLFGILFVSLLAHEGTHVLQSKSPESICYNMQQRTFASVSHNYHTEEEFEKFRLYSEKWADIITTIITIGLSTTLGVLISLFVIIKLKENEK